MNRGRPARLSCQWIAAVLLLGIAASHAAAQRSQGEVTAGTITISEPGVYQLSELYKHADIVGLVKIVSGDTENYDHAIYKGKVVKHFKGVSEGEIIYFGPYVGERLGWEYILFLRNNAEPIVPKSGPSISYGKIHYASIFNEGYSSMETSYKCIFDGGNTDQKCDYGVRVCTEYIKLPPKIPAFPPEDQEMPFGCRWVRKATLISNLESLKQIAK